MKRSTKIRIRHRGAPILFYPAALPLSSQTLNYTAGVIRRHRKSIGSPWRKLSPGQQALLVLAYLRKGETFAELVPPENSIVSLTCPFVCAAGGVMVG